MRTEYAPAGRTHHGTGDVPTTGTVTYYPLPRIGDDQGSCPHTLRFDRARPEIKPAAYLAEAARRLIDNPAQPWCRAISRPPDPLAAASATTLPRITTSREIESGESIH